MQEKRDKKSKSFRKSTDESKEETSPLTKKAKGSVSNKKIKDLSVEAQNFFETKRFDREQGADHKSASGKTPWRYLFEECRQPLSKLERRSEEDCDRFIRIMESLINDGNVNIYQRMKPHSGFEDKTVLAYTYNGKFNERVTLALINLVPLDMFFKISEGLSFLCNLFDDTNLYIDDESDYVFGYIAVIITPLLNRIHAIGGEFEQRVINQCINYKGLDVCPLFFYGPKVHRIFPIEDFIARGADPNLNNGIVIWKFFIESLQDTRKNEEEFFRHAFFTLLQNPNVELHNKLFNHRDLNEGCESWSGLTLVQAACNAQLHTKTRERMIDGDYLTKITEAIALQAMRHIDYDRFTPDFDTKLRAFINRHINPASKVLDERSLELYTFNQIYEHVIRNHKVDQAIAEAILPNVHMPSELISTIGNYITNFNCVHRFFVAVHKERKTDADKSKFEIDPGFNVMKHPTH